MWTIAPLALWVCAHYKELPKQDFVIGSWAAKKASKMWDWTPTTIIWLAYLGDIVFFSVLLPGYMIDFGYLAVVLLDWMSS